MFARVLDGYQRPARCYDDVVTAKNISNAVAVKERFTSPETVMWVESLVHIAAGHVVLKVTAEGQAYSVNCEVSRHV